MQEALSACIINLLEFHSNSLKEEERRFEFISVFSGPDQQCLSQLFVVFGDILY